MEKTKQIIAKLIEKYNRILEEKKVNKYNEEMTKKDFILPLFRALGWNVEDSNEVTAEENISKKRVDYGFRINGIPKFFLEAKALKENLDNPKYAEQAINYSWHKGCTWAVLTDFESIKIFNAEWKTKQLWQSHFKTISYQEYLDRFNELWLLSKESFQQGLLDKEAEKWGKKTKRISVDKQLLADFTKFREILSKSINKHNENRFLTEEDIDESVQRILDRLIFIRNCEDRELESKALISLIRDWKLINKRGSLIKELRKVFKEYDEKYNSKIFQHHLCDDVEINNETVAKVIEGLYYTKDKSVYYDFSAIEADVLGNIYEQYLGHILRKSEKRTKLKKSHAHRKEQGIYYTPTYIVDYIVQNTLGELLKTTKFQDVSKIRVLDPACGSGSFLIKAFDVLYDYYSKHYKNVDQLQIDYHTGTSFSTKLQILTHNIFGVDLDKQAVEIAQLNLLLKIAEKGHRLPLLQNNIKCGNSLIDDPQVAGDKAFNWEEEFPEIMQEGGFDVIIGNPPYGATINETQREFLSKKYKEDKTRNTAAYFIYRSFEKLKSNGYIGFIVPKQLTYISSWSYAREILSKNELLKIIDVSEAFVDVELEQVIFICRKSKPSVKILVGFSEKGKIVERPSYKKYFSNERFPLWITNKNYSIFDKILVNSQPLNEIAKVNWGGPVAKYLKQQCGTNDIPCIRGREVKRYSLISEWYIDKNDMIESYYVKGEKLLFQRIVSRCGKVLFANYRDARLAGTYTNEDIYADKTVTLIWDSKKVNIKYLLGLLNSKLISWFAHRFFWNRSQLTMEFMYEYARTFPIYISSQWELSLTTLVDKMLILHDRLKNLSDKLIDERYRIEEEIKKTDAEIDELIYNLYGLTEEEKRIVKDSFE